MGVIEVVKRGGGVVYHDDPAVPGALESKDRGKAMGCEEMGRVGHPRRCSVVECILWLSSVDTKVPYPRAAQVALKAETQVNPFSWRLIYQLR